MTSVVILQSNYIPWRGYFDLIREADVFIFYDEVQYTRRDWRNRNIIVTPHGEKWLSVPVNQSGKYEQKIVDTELSDDRWASKHWSTLRGTYAKSAGFKRWGGFFGELYEELQSATHLYQVNRLLLTKTAEALGIDTKFVCSSELQSEMGKTERLVGLCKAVGGTRYISGKAAQAYIEPEQFETANIDLVWKQYPDYAAYQQLDNAYRPGVSILDTLFQAPDLPLFEAAS